MSIDDGGLSIKQRMDEVWVSLKIRIYNSFFNKIWRIK